MNSNKTIKTIMSALAIFFLGIIGVFITTNFRFLTTRYDYASDLIGTIELLFMLPPCLIFYYQLLNKHSGVNLFQRPSFWITTGIFSFSTITIPFYMINKFMFSKSYEIGYLLSATLFDIPFALNFIFLIKAFSCKKALTT